MRKTKDILRLHLLAGVTSCRQIGRAAGCGKTAVAECLRRASAAGLTSWELVEGLDEDELEQRLYPATVKPSSRAPGAAVAGLSLGARGTGTARSQDDADAAVDGVQGRVLAPTEN